MKISKKILMLSVVLCVTATSSWASITIELDAGKLQTQTANVNLPAGSLLQIVATRAGGSGVFAAPTIGHYVNGDNLVVASFAMNNNFSAGETDNTFTFSLENTGAPSPATFDQGDALMLRWYPTITFAQFQSGTLPVNGTPFGQFTSGTGQAGGIAWFAPADGGSHFAPNGLNFETASVLGGSTIPDSAGVASLSVVPEPSPYALLALSLPLMLIPRLRRRLLAR